MTFKMKHLITKDYLPLVKSGRRQGIKMPKVHFIVAHDVGNDGVDSNKDGVKEGTAARNNVSYYKSTKATLASAHTFIDDKDIIECIPLTTGTPEKAWHVLYNRTLDNKLFGDDANDIAAGVELCYFPHDRARSLRAYEKFVWYCAYLIHKFNMNVDNCLIGHEHLDPGRKKDPTNGLRYSGKTYAQFVADVKAEYRSSSGKSTPTVTPKPAVAPPTPTAQIGVITVLVDSLNVRSAPSFTAPVVKQGGKTKVLTKGTKWKCYEKSNGLYRVGINQWVSAGAKYTSFTPVKAARATYTVKAGDSIWKIANNSKGKYSMDDLIKWNPGIEPSRLSIGQKIYISA